MAILPYKIFGIAGNPVLHSKSPCMHNAALSACNIPGIYMRIAAFNAQEILNIAKEIRITGLNITAPFKEEIIPLLYKVEKNAKKIGAVNTVMHKSGKFIGYNTDWIGARDAFLNNGIKLKDKKAVVLGAGGAAKAAAFGLLKSGAKVVILNRTDEKAKNAAVCIGCTSAKFENLKKELKNAHILVSALSTSERVIPISFLHSKLIVMDANYTHSILSQDAKKLGCKVINGLEWLLYQANPSFKIFTNKDISPEIMRNALYSFNNIKKSNIALIGFMGAGKSTIGKILAAKKFMNFERFGKIQEKTSMKFIDTDKEIERLTGKTIRQIFAENGEHTFREMENKFVRKKIAGSQNTIFSCGGGIILNEQNLRIIKENCICVLLWAPLKEMLKRIDSNRPLLQGENKEQKAQTLLKNRIPAYAKAADIVIRTAFHGPEQIAERIEYEFKKCGGKKYETDKTV